MLDDLQKILEEQYQLNRTQPIIVGVSGGADSLTLLNILVKLGYPIVVAHFNHLLRPEASDDAHFVEMVAETHKIPFTLGVGSAADYAQEYQLSIEEAARNLRYKFLFEQAKNYEAQAVAVAHNADDQVETVLMHLLRGAGLDGLTGMPYASLPNPWSEGIPLIRPMLGIWRSEIEAYCNENSLTPILDSTNNNTTFFRNKLRHELIPTLETYVPGLRNRLFQTADLLAADRCVLDELTQKIWLDLLEESGMGFVGINLQSFKQQSLGIQRRLIRKALTQLRPGARDFDFPMVKQVVDFAAQPTNTGQINIGVGLRAFIEQGKLFIAAWEADLPTAHWPHIIGCHSLNIPGELELENGWILKTEISKDVESAKREAQENCDPYRAWLDLGERQPLLNLRTRLPGDRFQPLGMGGKSMKISNFMINQKIPQRSRAAWPLVCVGDEIIWVPGYRLAHPFRVNEKSQRIVLLTLLQVS